MTNFLLKYLCLYVEGVLSCVLCLWCWLTFPALSVLAGHIFSQVSKSLWVLPAASSQEGLQEKIIELRSTSLTSCRQARPGQANPHSHPDHFNWSSQHFSVLGLGTELNVMQVSPIWSDQELHPGCLFLTLAGPPNELKVLTLRTIVLKWTVWTVTVRTVFLDIFMFLIEL